MLCYNGFLGRLSRSNLGLSMTKVCARGDSNTARSLPLGVACMCRVAWLKAKRADTYSVHNFKILRPNDQSCRDMWVARAKLINHRLLEVASVVLPWHLIAPASAPAAAAGARRRLCWNRTPLHVLSKLGCAFRHSCSF